jgi:choline dehydrogenase-like flavoprotein
LLPLADADFEHRPWLADSGWPVRAADLAAYYRRAQAVFQLPELGYAAENWEEPWARQLPLASPDVRTGIFQFGRGDLFLDTHRRALECSRNITILHHATALEALTDESASHVTAIRAASMPGRTFQARAKHFVLAMGGMGSAQLLLASDGIQSGGLGNAFDNVGRYFMDHPLLYGGEFFPASPRLFEAMEFYDLRSIRGTPIMGHLQLSDEALGREGLLNLSAMFFPREANYEAHRRYSPRQRAGFEAANRLRHAGRNKVRPFAADVWRALKAVDGFAKRGRNGLLYPQAHLGRGGWSKLSRKAQRFAYFDVFHQAEQAPHRDNRITLSQERNRFGTRRLHVDWRWHDADVSATMNAQEVFARALEEAGLGQFRIKRQDGRPVVALSSTSHYMGTTRMHENPRHGVVDAQCRVHGIDNLFIASSSVFPTGGFANPTLTVVALALRVADRIRTLERLPDGVRVLQRLVQDPWSQVPSG